MANKKSKSTKSVKITVEDAIIDDTPIEETSKTKKTKITVEDVADAIESGAPAEDTETGESENIETEGPENPEDSSESKEIPVSTKDIAAAIESPVEEPEEELFADTGEDDIEALINEVSLEEDDEAETEGTEEEAEESAKITEIENETSEAEEETADDKTSAKTKENKSSKKSKKLQNKEDSMKSAKKTPKKAKPFRIISRILALCATGALGLLIVRVVTTGILPNKYLIPAIVASALIVFFLIFKAFRKKTHLKVLAFTDILSVVLTIASIFGYLKVDETMRFLDNNFGTDQEYSVYNVIVSTNSNYNSLSDVKGKTFHSISDFVDTEKLEKAAKEQASATLTYEDGITSLLKNTMDSTSYIAVLNSGTYSAALENDESKTYEKGLKVIGELKVEIEKSDRGSKSNLTENSFVVYISGIDTRTGTMVDRSLSDVNIVMAVNPKTKRILMVAIPRDYYVQLHGTSGLPDKLTHAGSLGGIELSMSTIEDLLDMKFDHYFRANFNAVIGLVDAIDGITVYSDVNYNITAWTDSSCVFYPGNNNVDGKCALAFARERYAYSSGDRHRGENQEQVIEKIINKISSSSTIISKYSDILNALSGSFETSIATKDITSLVNMQISDMSSWTIESYNLNGTTGMAYTYSYPSQALSVMHPDYATVKIAQDKIDAVLEGREYVANTDGATNTAESSR